MYTDTLNVKKEDKLCLFTQNSTKILKKDFLSMKHKREDRINFQSNYNECERLCDVCLEQEIYSESKLIECRTCSILCHEKCMRSTGNRYDFNLISIDKLKNNQYSLDRLIFQCSKCVDIDIGSKKSNLNLTKKY